MSVISRRAASLLSFIFLVPLCGPSAQAQPAWGCYDPQPGHPTAAERKAFIASIAPLAIAAEHKHHVPAPAIAAMAIGESGYGFTRTALEANNLFGFKMPRRGADGRTSFTLACQPNWDPGNSYIHFRDRADAIDFVANRLETQSDYAAATHAFAMSAPNARSAAIAAWLAAIATHYNYNPPAYRVRIGRIINNPLAPSDTVDAHTTLYSLVP